MNHFTTDINDIPFSLRPLWVIERRLVAQCEAGGLIAGTKFIREGNVEAKGKNDLPMVQVLEVTDAEALPIAGNALKYLRTDKVLRLEVATAVEYGLFARAPKRQSTDKKKDLAAASSGFPGTGLLELVELVKDSIEIDYTSGRIDALLGGTIESPLTFSVVETMQSAVGWHAVLQVTITQDMLCRGLRLN